jgi:hypothetical protein
MQYDELMLSGALEYDPCSCCGDMASNCLCFGTGCPKCGMCYAHCNPTAPECQNDGKTVGLICTECGRLESAPHRNSCPFLLAPPEPNQQERCPDRQHDWEASFRWGIIIGVSKCRRCGAVAHAEDFDQ